MDEEALILDALEAVPAAALRPIPGNPLPGRVNPLLSELEVLLLAELKSTVPLEEAPPALAALLACLARFRSIAFLRRSEEIESEVDCDLFGSSKLNSKTTSCVKEKRPVSKF